MKTSELFETLNRNITKKLKFVLSDGRTLKDDLHITEVKHITGASVDCGMNEHSFKETIIQLWVNEFSSKQAEWSGEKAISILNKVGSKKYYDLTSEVFIEYGDRITPTSKYSIQTVNEESDQITLNLFVKPTECKVLPAMQAACC